jgi:hypothetical protein
VKRVKYKGTLNYDSLRLDHQAHLKKVNDVLVETALAVQGLQLALQDAETKLTKGQKRYTLKVPNKRTKVVPIHRNLRKLVSSLKDQISSKEYIQALVFIVSIVESYLSSNLIRLLRAYPKKLLVSTKGKELQASESYSVDMREIVAAASIDDIVDTRARQRVRDAMYASPKQYLSYFSSISGFKPTPEAWNAFIELKATRDLYVHGDGTINEIYIEKVGTSGRGQVGDMAIVDSQYFDKSISCLKEVMSNIFVGLREKYSDSEDLKRVFDRGD